LRAVGRMLDDARRIEFSSEIETDLCIVGAGAAGITIARALDGSAARICLLEGGGLRPDPATNALYRGYNAGLPYFPLDVCQLRAFGGNTNAWGGWCRPLDPIDFEARPWVPDSGWPLSRADLGEYYLEAHELCQLRRKTYAVEEWLSAIGDRNAKTLAVDPALLETVLHQFSPPTRFGAQYGEEIRRSRNVLCLLHANVVNIATDLECSRVTRLDVACLGGNRFSVKAKIFVLSAGGTENARLLLVSRDVAPSGLGNAYDLVGRFFMEHPHLKRRILVASGRPPLLLYGLNFHDKGISARLALSPSLQEREGLLNYSANILPIYAGAETAGWTALRKLVLSMSRSRRGDPFLRFPPYGPKRVELRDLWSILRHLPDAAAAGFLHLLKPPRFIRGYVLESKSEQAPNPDSRLTLSHDRDELGVNRIRIDWRLGELDRRTILRGEEIIGQELERLGIGRLEPLADDFMGGRPGVLEGGWHQLGMTRMHVDPKRGVVDPNCRVHGISNLFIAGGSVFPTEGNASPTLTIVALALRLADHLKSLLRQRPRTVIERIRADAEATAAATVGQETSAVAADSPPPPLLSSEPSPGVPLSSNRATPRAASEAFVARRDAARPRRGNRRRASP